MNLENTTNFIPKENNQKKKSFFKLTFAIIRYIHLLIPIVLFLAESIWIYFIIKGYENIGKLPTYGDPEIVSVHGFDRKLVIYSLVFMFYGSGIWLFLSVSNYFLKKYEINTTAFVLGIVSITIALILFCSPQCTWLLD